MTADTADIVVKPPLHTSALQAKLVAAGALALMAALGACLSRPNLFPAPLTTNLDRVNSWLGLALLVPAIGIALVAAAVLSGRNVDTHWRSALKLMLSLPLAAVVLDGIDFSSGGGEWPLGGELGRLLHNGVRNSLPVLADPRLETLFVAALGLTLFQLIISLLRAPLPVVHPSAQPASPSTNLHARVPSEVPLVEALEVQSATQVPRRGRFVRWVRVTAFVAAALVGLAVLYAGTLVWRISRTLPNDSPACRALDEAAAAAHDIASRATSLKELIRDTRNLGTRDLASRAAGCARSDPPEALPIRPITILRAPTPAAGPVTPKEERQGADEAPAGSFERQTPGALSQRDYSRTELDARNAIDVINAYRRQKDVGPLKLHAQLEAAALAHAADLAKWDRISHYGSDGSNPWDRVRRTGYNAKVAAENVGTGQVNFKELLEGWKQSPGHHKNLILADADEAGLALVKDTKTEFKTFWVLVIGRHL